MSGEKRQLFQDVIEDVEFRNFLSEQIKVAVTDCGTLCPIPNDMKESLSHLSETIKTLGDGNLDQGIERFRKNHEFVKGLRSAQKKAGEWVGKAVVTGFILVIIALIGKGIWGDAPPPWE